MEPGEGRYLTRASIKKYKDLPTGYVREIKIKVKCTFLKIKKRWVYKVSFQICGTEWHWPRFPLGKFSPTNTLTENIAGWHMGMIGQRVGEDGRGTQRN